MAKTKETPRMTIKVSVAAEAYNLISKLSISEIEKEDQFAVLRAANALRKIADPFNKFVEEAQERLRPEGWNDAINKLRLKQLLTESENDMLRKYDADVSECVKNEADKEVEIDDYTRLDDDGLSAVISVNKSLDVSRIMLLQDYLC